MTQQAAVAPTWMPALICGMFAQLTSPSGLGMQDELHAAGMSAQHTEKGMEHGGPGLLQQTSPGTGLMQEVQQPLVTAINIRRSPDYLHRRGPVHPLWVPSCKNRRCPLAAIRASQASQGGCS